jgi:hypothetical protein
VEVGPGKHWPSASSSVKTSGVIHRSFSTMSFWNSATCAVGPPNAALRSTPQLLTAAAPSPHSHNHRAERLTRELCLLLATSPPPPGHVVGTRLGGWTLRTLSCDRGAWDVVSAGKCAVGCGRTEPAHKGELLGDADERLGPTDGWHQRLRIHARHCHPPPPPRNATQVQ